MQTFRPKITNHFDDTTEMLDLSLEFTKQMAKDRLATRIHRSSERMNNPNEVDGSKNKMANEAGVRSCS